MKAVSFVRILIAIVTCAIVGLPLVAFPALRAFFMDQGLYEDLCQVHSMKNIHCLARQLRFDKFFAHGAVGSGLGALLGYYLVENIGFSFSSMAGAVLIALGCYLIGSSPEEVTGVDSYIWGYFFLCLGAPLAVFSAIDAASLVEGWPLPLVVFLLAIAQLSSGIWQLAIKLFEPGNAIELFNHYLYVPAFLIAANVLVTPLCTQTPPGNASRLIKRLFKSGGIALEQGRNDLPLMEHNVEEIDESLWAIANEGESASKIRSKWFALVFLFFGANMLVMDGFLSSGPEYAWSVNEAPGKVILFLSVFAPATTAVGIIAVGGAFLVMSHFVIICITGILCAMCPVLLIFGFWRAVSLLVPFNRILLHAAAFNYCVRVFGFSSLGFTYGMLNLFSSMLAWLLPVIDSYLLTYEGPSRNLMISVSAFQICCTLIALRMFATKCSFIDRQLLEREAENSVRNAISI